MKSFSSRRRRGSGFTLVELLVVMGIIAILAAVVIGAVGSAIRFAKRTKANAMASQISTAVQNYYTEYSVYPTVYPAITTDDYYDGGSEGNWATITTVLCGNLNPYSGTTTTPPNSLNSRGIAYLTPTRSDVNMDGAIVNPFGNSIPANGAQYFYMVVDTDYSGVAGDSAGTGNLIDFSSTSSTISYLGHGVPGGVAVWCSCDQPTAGSNSNPKFWAHTY